MAYTILTISGGIGKNIQATCVAAAIKKKYPDHKLVVQTAWPDVFINNPNVYRVLPFGSPYFQEDYMKEDTLFFHQEPYRTSDFIKKEKHMIDLWCELCGVDTVPHKPELFLTDAEMQFAHSKFQRQKPLFVMHTNGGANSTYSWARDLPNNQANMIAKVMSQTHHVMQIRRDNQPAVEGAEQVKGNIRELFALIRLADKRLFIDSFAHHVAGAYELPAVVCWIATSPKVYSYSNAHDILPKQEPKFVHGYGLGLGEDWEGNNIQDCPYELGDLFDVGKILEGLK